MKLKKKTVLELFDYYFQARLNKYITKLGSETAAICEWKKDVQRLKQLEYSLISPEHQAREESVFDEQNDPPDAIVVPEPIPPPPGPAERQTSSILPLTTKIIKDCLLKVFLEAEINEKYIKNQKTKFTKHNFLDEEKLNKVIQDLLSKTNVDNQNEIKKKITRLVNTQLKCCGIYCIFNNFFFLYEY